MSKISWKSERDRLRKMARDIKAMRDRIWNNAGDPSWDRPLGKIGEEFDFLANQMDAQKCGSTGRAP